ncbi:MFS multidrug transporter, putative [Metarhizium acridum CQMa 102]|uniref:MFS multidrug transporter, putative n=1 Tax=Metarhizium acridum (strain CQMa 102) TaxID=655827 RepID=E9EHR2_METAQ|nr:MFS multidrug transporter, putative [Metarhizium acridum CQMa 102]EFY84533.1 MFS multidrug transporter, putative [Metarhizium acridum CQMa 102]
MLFTSATIFCVSLYMAFAYGCLHLLFNTIPPLLQDTYHFSIGITGLVYLAVLAGYVCGLGLFYLPPDRTVVRVTEANDGVYKPEKRLRDCIWFALAITVTFFIFGGSADKVVNWIVSVVGLVPLGFGIISVWAPIHVRRRRVSSVPGVGAGGIFGFEKYGWCFAATGWAADVQELWA